VFRVALLVLVVACETANPVTPVDSWTTVQMDDGTGVPPRRLEMAAGALGTRLVIAGGFSTGMTEGNLITMDVLTYDTASGEWGALPPAPVAWTHANVAAVGGVVYLLGGLEGASFQPNGAAYALDTRGASPTWQQLASMPAGEERGAAAVVVSAGHIYLLGGASRFDALATSLDFDIDPPAGTSPWSRFVDLPTPRSHAAAIRRAGDGTIIVAGGLEDLTTTRPLADVYALPLDDVVLPPETPVWQLRSTMPTARGGCAYGNLFGRLVCAGGEAGLDALDVVEIYDPNLDTWTTGEAMPEPRAGARGTVVGDRLYVPGGSATVTRFEPTDSLFVYATNGQ